jgi:hypothetical protein
MVAISIGFSISAAAMWGVATVLSACHGSILGAGMARAVAAAATILAGMCWLEARRERERGRRDGDRAGVHDECRRREEVLILALNSQVDAPTGPLQRLRAI